MSVQESERSTHAHAGVSPEIRPAQASRPPLSEQDLLYNERGPFFVGKAPIDHFKMGTSDYKGFGT